MIDRIILLCLFIACIGCSATVPKEAVNKWRTVKVLELADITDPITKQATKSGKVAEVLKVGLESRGYEVCVSPCEADALAEVRVAAYMVQSSNPFALIHPGASRSVISFELFIYDENKEPRQVIFKRGAKNSARMDLDQLLATMVRGLVQEVPTSERL